MKKYNLQDETVNSVKTSVIGSFFKCKAVDYSSFVKGKIYHKDSIGEYLIDNYKDWVAVLDYPTAKELLDYIENGTNKSKIVKSLKQWKNCR